jgi:hypothetical protein
VIPAGIVTDAQRALLAFAFPAGAFAIAPNSLSNMPCKRFTSGGVIVLGDDVVILGLIGAVVVELGEAARIPAIERRWLLGNCF